MTHLRVQEWEQVTIGPDDLPEAAVAKVMAAWAAITGKSADDFFRLGRGKLSVRNWTGILSTDQVQLEVEPRGAPMPGTPERAALDRNLNLMLEAVSAGTIASGPVGATGEGSRYDAAVRALVTATESALRAYRPRRYVERREDLPHVRGRVDAVRTSVLRLRRPAHSSSRWVELSADTPALRFVKSALSVARTRVGPAARRRVDRLVVDLDEVATVGPDLASSHELLSHAHPSWRRPLVLATDILSGRVSGLLSGRVVSIGEVVFTPTLFEEFVALGVTQELAASSVVAAQVETTPGQWGGLGDRPFDAPPFHLDIEVRKPDTGEVTVVIDTKWKHLLPRGSSLGVASDDVQQMIAYARLTQCRSAALVYPVMAATAPLPSTPTLLVKGLPPLKIRVYWLPMAADDVSTELRRLARVLAADAAA